MHLSAIPSAVRHHAEERSLPSPGGMVEYYFLSMITDFRLKVFETVARRLNFTRAAEELFITQPAVTRHIKELERLLDARLFKGRDEGLP